MRRRIPWPTPALAFALVLTACMDVQQPAAPPAADVGITSAPTLTVMSQNMYLGADLDPLLDSSIPPEQALANALAQLQHTDYPARAYYLAYEIATRQPDVVGLQEVTDYVLDTAAGIQEIDYLAILQAYLAGFGVQYDVAVHQTNVVLPLTVGFGGINSVTYSDGDAILVRHDIPWSDADAAHFATQAIFSVGAYSFPNLHGWNAVTVTVDGYAFRFVNVHVEVQLFPEVQEAQAQELVSLFGDATLPVIMVGDFNSAANPGAPPESKTVTYHLLRNAGFADLELRDAHSATFLTCCHAPDLSDVTPSFDQRLDLVLAKMNGAGFGGQSQVDVVGTSDRFLDGSYYLWPSDHAGVFATLQVAPGLASQ